MLSLGLLSSDSHVVMVCNVLGMLARFWVNLCFVGSVRIGPVLFVVV